MHDARGSRAGWWVFGAFLVGCAVWSGRLWAQGTSLPSALIAGVVVGVVFGGIVGLAGEVIVGSIHRR